MEKQDEQVTERPVPLLGEGGFQATNTDLLPSVESARDFIRQFKAELTGSGALLLIAGKFYVMPSAFTHEIIKIGRSSATSKVVDDIARELERRRRIVKSLEGMLVEEQSALRVAEAAASSAA